ncbi:hypothetical protein OG909_24495 [Streptomyces sp. NBC_01754]|nr:hypothetical protein OG909_24495 [Streptomyces sp. NBC_01754]
MSEPKKQGAGGQPEPTPQEWKAQDHERVQGQLIVTDVTRGVQGIMEAVGFSSSGRTSFEAHPLNTMIDLIENSDPARLEAAGEALFNARTALVDAAKELGDFIGQVDWEGESGTAFRDWGNGLVAHARNLGAFAQTAGTQITVAGSGLASVRASLPPRDSRIVRKKPEEIELPKRTESNPEYTAAVKVEKDRQEAINQANRLASYYSVSEERLAAQEPPRFEKKLGVAVPRPQGRIDPHLGSGSPQAGSETVASPVGRVSPEQTASVNAVSVSGPGLGSQPGIEAVAAAPVPGRNISMELNTVATPPAPVATPGPSPVPSPVGPAVPGGGPPVGPVFVNPVTSNSQRPRGPQGAPRSVSQPEGGGPAANGRGGAPLGRPTPLGSGSPSGRSGFGGADGRNPLIGESGVTGGRPVAAGPAAGAGTPRPPMGRAGGIVGGTPQRSVPGAGTSAGSRGLPRGPVIGAGGAPQGGGSAGGAGRGVIGAGAPSSTSRPGGRGASSSNGVVGKPRGSAAGAGVGARGFTSGGSGLVRGSVGRRDSGEEEQDDGTLRPDYLTEDRETWEAGRRAAAPPVIE